MLKPWIERPDDYRMEGIPWPNNYNRPAMERLTEVIDPLGTPLFPHSKHNDVYREIHWSITFLSIRRDIPYGTEGTTWDPSRPEQPSEYMERLFNVMHFEAPFTNMISDGYDGVTFDLVNAKSLDLMGQMTGEATHVSLVGRWWSGDEFSLPYTFWVGNCPPVKFEAWVVNKYAPGTIRLSIPTVSLAP